MQMVLRCLLGAEGREMYGLEVCAGIGLASGTVHPILTRLEGLGWLTSRREDATSAHAEGHPSRRYWRFTTDGAAKAQAALDRRLLMTEAERAPETIAGEGIL